jgi:hypothetical protein
MSEQLTVRSIARSNPDNSGTRSRVANQIGKVIILGDDDAVVGLGATLDLRIEGLREIYVEQVKGVMTLCSNPPCKGARQIRVHQKAHLFYSAAEAITA